MQTCPECDDEYQLIGRHWSSFPDHRPELTKNQKELSIGLLMGDATVEVANRENGRMILVMTNRKYLEYLGQEFPLLSNSITLRNSGEELLEKAKSDPFLDVTENSEYRDQYRISFSTHPHFTELREWYKSDGKVFPSDINLTPTVLKTWYVCDGHIENNHEGKSSSMCITCWNERNNIEKILKYFRETGLPEPRMTREGARLQWKSEESEKIFQYMGDPPPGFQAKWPIDW